MFFKKKLREADREITKDSVYMIDSEDNAVINIKAERQEQIFSQYNYDSNEKLNPELHEFIVDKARFVPAPKDIRIRLYTGTSINEKEVEMAIRNDSKKEYIETKKESRRNLIFSAIMLIVGCLFLALMVLLHSYFDSIYLEVIDILAWVFVWEAADSFFLQRMEIKHKMRTYLKLYSAEIEVVKLKALSKTSEKNIKKED